MTKPKKHKPKKKTGDATVRSLLIKEEDQEYGVVLQKLGGARMKVHCFDQIERICLIRGNMRKRRGRVWIDVDDHVLIGLREYESGQAEVKKADIIYKYTPAEVKQLINLEEITKFRNERSNIQDELEDEIAFDFEAI
jgi:translation initiation factor 1A